MSAGSTGNKTKSHRAARETGRPIWNRIPRLLNQLRDNLQLEQRGETLVYEPIHLHVAPSEVHPVMAALEDRTQVMRSQHLGIPDSSGPETLLSSKPGKNVAALPFKQLGYDHFKFLLDQVSTVRTIQFSGKTDPFRNAELLRMVDYAYWYNGAESTIVTDGTLLNLFADELLKGRLHTLLVKLHAHRPSSYAQITNQPPDRFVTILDNIRRLTQRKRELGSHVEIEVSMTLDLHSFRSAPEMIAFCEDLGVDGLRFENYLPKPGGKTDRTLYTNQEPIVRFFKELAEGVAADSPLLITLPVLLDPDMSGNRHCLDPYTTVSVDADFNVTGCSRQRLYRPPLGKAWDKDFWNNADYQWLRSIHSSGGSAEIPLACQTCPRNMPCGQ